MRKIALVFAVSCVSVATARAQVCPPAPEDPDARVSDILDDSDALVEAAKNDTFGIGDRARYHADVLEANGHNSGNVINDTFERATGRAPSDESWRIALEALRNVRVVPSLEGGASGETSSPDASRRPEIEISVEDWAPLDRADQTELLVHEFIHALSYAEYGVGLDEAYDHQIIDDVARRLNYEHISCEPSIPPAPPTSASGSSHGDPHLQTFDGFAYSFQAVGEFVLARSNSGFEAQARQQKFSGQPVSLNTAVAVRSGARRIAIYAGAFDGLDLRKSPVLIDGKAQKISKGGKKVGDAKIYAVADDAWRIDFNTGEVVEVERRRLNERAFLDVRVNVSGTPNGIYSGLLGNFDGVAENDLKSRSGDIISQTASPYGGWIDMLTGRINAPIPLSAALKSFYDALHRKFGESWRVSDSETLFDYGVGQAAADFTDRAFPERYLATSMFLPEQVRAADEICRAANVDIDFLQGCIFDVALTGDASFGKIALGRLEKAARSRAENEARSRIEGELRRRLPF
jgi:hypothetical protein